MRLVYLIILLTFQTLCTYAQDFSWDESSASKAHKVIFPEDLTINLPDTGTYQIGYFIYDESTSSFVNVGQAAYIPGKEVSIELGYDPAGVTGYKVGDRFITLIRNNANSQTYGVEFSYLDDKKWFALNGISYVSGVITSTWRDFLDNRFYFCKTEPPVALHIPYGLKPSIYYTNDIVIDTSGDYPVLLFSEMGPTAGTIQMFTHGITYKQTLYAFILKEFPEGKLNKTYSICPGEIIIIPEYEDTLRRTPVADGSYTLLAEGKYLFDVVYEKYGCRTKDTIIVTAPSEPCEKYNYPEVINPEYGSEIVFPEAGGLTILNAALEKVHQFKTPAIWNGTDSNGNLLPVGIYYIVHENGYMHSISIIY
ncbi:MAG TPA: hypothetical protein VIK89_07325 [Cytophagaceae bacterium]